MQHPDEGTIHAWLDGELSADKVVSLEAHVAECDECSARVAEARGLIAASSRIVSALDIVPAGVIPIAPSPVTRAWYTGVQFRAAAAVVVVAAASLLLLTKGNQENAARATVTAADVPVRGPVLQAPAPAKPSASATAPLAPQAKNGTTRVAQAPVVPEKNRGPVKSSTEVSEVTAGAMQAINQPTAQNGASEKASDAAANVVVGGVAMADAVTPQLTQVKTDTSANSVRNVYEVSPGVEVTLVETPVTTRNFTASAAAKVERAAIVASPTAAPVAAPAPPVPPSSMRRANVPINTITWIKGTRTMTLTGAMSVEELTAIRKRLPEDKR